MHGSRIREIGIATAVVLFGILLLVAAPARRPSSATTQKLFTPEHPSVMEAVRDFFGWRPQPVQPIAFPHKTHLAHNLKCEGCHGAASIGPVAGIPNVKFCMSCHQLYATDKPEIRKLAAYFRRGEDIPWQRVYGFTPAAHVKFNHAPHIRNNVQCASCHGDMTQQTVAVRAVKLTMGFCLDCHRRNRAPTDCVACHF